MKTIQHVMFFLQHERTNLKKKWPSLLLLFIIPLVLIASLTVLVVSFFTEKEQHPLQLVLVDENPTKESQMMAQLLILTVADTDHLDIKQMDKEAAFTGLNNNDVTTIVEFPAEFTDDLMNGRAVQIIVTENASKRIDTYLIRELLNSLALYIESAQANILTLYDYAKKTNMSKAEYEQFRFDQFMNFTMDTLGKSNLLWKQDIQNIVTDTPLNYYAMAALYSLLIIWVVGFYVLLRKEESAGVHLRYTLYNVTQLERMSARAIWAFFFANSGFFLCFFGVSNILNLDLLLIDYVRIALFAFFLSATLLVLLMVIDLLIFSIRIKILAMSAFAFISIFTSGALIPAIYFPASIRLLLPYNFTYVAFEWILDISILGRNYAEYELMLAFYVFCGLLLVGISLWKERWQS